MSINATALSGSVVRQDCELRTTASGKSVARFTLCWQRPVKNAKGEWENVPGYIGIVLFGSRAEALAPKLTRGTKVAVQGELRYSTWEKDGQAASPSMRPNPSPSCTARRSRSKACGAAPSRGRGRFPVPTRPALAICPGRGLAPRRPPAHPYLIVPARKRARWGSADLDPEPVSRSALPNG